mgnify:CR=1 FL=1
MNKILTIARREFIQRVRSRTFLLTAIGTPLILILIWVFTGDVGSSQPPDIAFKLNDETVQTAVGYVDQAGIITRIPEPLPAEMYRAYPDQASAEQDVRTGLIEAYFLIPEDYQETGAVQRISRSIPTSPPETGPFEYLLLKNQFSDLDQGHFSRLRNPLQGLEPQFVSLSPGEESGSGAGFSMLPFVVTMAIMLPLFTGGGYLLQSLTKEKSNQMMEVLLVSIRPRQLLAGKLMGLGVLVLVQYAAWLLIAGILFSVLNQSPGSMLADVSLTMQELSFVLPYALGGFCLYAALMGGIGALAPDMEGSRVWTFMITLPMMAPIYFWTAITNNPGGPIALALSYFPYSAPVAMLLRITVSHVPVWQLSLSLGLLVGAVWGTLWAMSRLFHAQALLSGESLSLGRFWEAFVQG